MTNFWIVKGLVYVDKIYKVHIWIITRQSTIQHFQIQQMYHCVSDLDFTQITSRGNKITLEVPAPYKSALY